MKKEILINLLQEITPSTVIMQNCLELIQREQVGIKKYGVTLSDAGLSHEQLLQHLLEEQLDAANYTRKALMTATKAHVDYAKLRKCVEILLRRVESMQPDVTTQLKKDDSPEYAYLLAAQDVSEEIKQMLFRFDADKVKRDLRK